MAFSTIIVYVVLNFLCVESLGFSIKRPTISSYSGQFFFKAPYGKNIILNTLEGGTVNLNGVDLSKAVEMVLNASHILDKYTINFENSFNKIDEIRNAIHGHNGVLERLHILDGDCQNMINTTTTPVPNAKITKLQKQLQSAVADLASLTSLLNADECKSNPCSNGGICQDLFNNFICHCPDEWEGQHCDVDVNECARFVGTDLGCQNGATCINKPGSYQCLCPNGWYGIHCTRRSKDCNSASSSSLCGHGTCIPQNTDLGYKCLCDQGYTNNGPSQECVDVDECKSGRPHCSVNPLVTCINTLGSFRCGNCPEGFTGNGFYCKDIDECQNTLNVCSKNPLVECINTLGSYKCGQCPPGYSGDGQTCTYQGICNVNNGGCSPLASCTDNMNNALSLVFCTCPPGYTGNGMGPNGCVASQTAWSPCHPNPCKNGTCVANNSSYSCLCNSPYFGKNCENSLFPCASNPCENGGTCQTRSFTFKCLCPVPWTGPTCRNERSACGGVLSEESGTLKYPPYNFSIRPEVRSCAWIIETSKNKILKMKFKEFHLKYTKDCNKDWVQIHDGRNTASHSLGRYCGSDLPKNGSFSSTHNAVYIWFRTDGTSSNSGFELSWDSAAPMCSFNLTTRSHGSIQSPGSPGNYPNNRDCFWIITVPAGKRLLFHFFSFDIGDSFNCTGDYLEVLPSSNYESVPIAKYCNSSVLPSPLNTPGSVALVHFHSDDKGQHPGFQISYSVIEGIPDCGGTYTKDRGEIHSPSYEGRYFNNLNCEYKIKLTPGLRVKLEFITFELEKEESCQFDYLEIFEGSDTNSPTIGRYCGSTLPGPYLSNGNEITLHFVSDWATAFQGFLIRYETVCGGKFTDKTGIITSDGYPTRYASHISCLYEIIQPLGYIINLSFLDFQLEHSGDDCFDYVEIRDGDNENSTLIGKYCSKPPDIVSTMNRMWIKFITDANVGDIGFRANYSVTNLGCGGILTQKTGIISPQFDSGIVGSSFNCTWVIRAPPGELIQVIWVTFQLKQRYICDHDYVLVYDNNTMTERGGFIGKYCGSKIPPSFISTSNMITLSLFLAPSSLSSGFTLSYNFLEEVKLCGGDFHSPGGVIRSPNYLVKSSTNMDCTWSITAESNHQILLNVTYFSMENIENCKYDYLEIRNGKSASSPLIGRYCGTKMPKLISSQANQIYLHFKTDNRGYGGHFEVIWGSAATGCGGVLSAPTGSIVSPMYPEPYDRYTDCHWKISVSSGSIVQIIFTDIDLEAHSFCMLDYVEVFDGSSAASKSLGKFCTITHPTFIRTTQNQAYVRFKSDVSFQGRGFQLQYTTVCQNNVTGFYGVIESPNFPNSYELPEDCIWNIFVEPKNKINITFTTFDVRTWYDSGNKTCASNSLEIKYPSPDLTTDSSETYDLYGKYCGHMDTPKLIALNHNEVQIHYSTHGKTIGSGFRLEWVLDGCGGKLYNSGIIQSPNYPKGYPESSACRWEMETDYGYSIVLSFDIIDLERAHDCHYDSIEVYNGPDKTYPKLAHFCHQDVPIKVTSNGHKMSLYFTADSSYQGRGFSGNFTSVKSKCGGRMTMSKGSIFSPNYPKNYDKDEACEWLLEVDENHLIDLEFEVVELLKNDLLCSKNYIKVYDGPSAAYPVLAKLCGETKPNKTLTSTHNTMLVEFHGGSFLTSKGFLAHFHKACGARIVASVSGEIQMHPEFVDSMNCSWTIIAPEPNQHIALTVTHMDAKVQDCSAYLHVYDGENENGRSLGEYCGRTIPGMIVSRGNSLHIVADIYMFLTASYEIYDSSCGGILNSLAGSITSPGFIDENIKLGTTPSESECEWTISAGPGNQISMTFTSFKVPASDKCKTDFLEIRQHNSSGKLVGLFCGDKNPADISMEGGLWLYLKLSANQDGKHTSGLKASYTVAHSNVLTAPYGQIASPLYPKYFNSYDDYTWRISVAFQKKISIKFKEITLGVHYDVGCSNSGMKIYDGLDDTAALLKELCDYDNPEPVKSSSNEVFISVYFASGNSRFLIEWQETYNFISPPTKNSTVEGCGFQGIIDMTKMKNYTLTSPGFPEGYANDLNCEWTFSTSSTNHLAISFTWLDLKSTYGIDISCDYPDAVDILSGKEETDEWKSVKKICLMNDIGTFFTSNLMKVKFTTDFSGNATGFKAVIKEECGGEISASEGEIIFDAEHPRGSLCQWNITVPTGKTISVDFPSFNIAPGQPDGCKNYLMLRNGLLPDSPPLGNGQYCGTIQPVLKTTSNQLKVKYIGTANVKGFILHFRAVSFECGGSRELDIYGNSTTISSPNYPDVPFPHIDCVWIIRSPPGTSIQLDFQDRFDLTQSEGCIPEAVELRNGATEFSPLIGRFCKSLPSSQFSTDNIMYIKFFTDVDDPRNGFKATASIAKCGGTYRGTFGRISWSADDSRLFHGKNNCTWHIVGPPDTNLVLTLDTLNMMFYSFGCIGNLKGVHIYSIDPINRKEKHIKDICSRNDTNAVININSNEAVIYHQHIYIAYSIKQFSLIYNATKQSCTFNLNTPSGRISTPGYPKLAYRLLHCKWTIRVPAGRRIKLTFSDLYFDQNLDYHNQGIAMLDSESIRMPMSLIRLYNGSNIGVRRQFKSSSNTMVIYYWSVNAHSRGFSAVYDSNEETVCQGSFNESSGSIAFPQAPTFFCSWKRQQTHWNTTLKASVTMHLKSRPTATGNCRSGSSAVMVYNSGTSWNLQFSLCTNTTSPAVLRTSYPNLDLQIWGKRELLNYTFDYDTYPCGGLRTEESGVISSPNYPNGPSSSFECSWLLKLPREHQINVSLNALDLGDDCDKSFLEIFNGPTPKSPRIEKLCKANKATSPILSERNILLINYHSSADSKGKGFNLTYAPIINGCGGIFHDKSRIIQTPNYPRDYPNNTECVWEIRAPDGYHIGLSFLGRFHLEESDRCVDDSLEVWDWQNQDWYRLNTYCGREIPPNINSTGNKMKIRFRSNDKIQARGFQAKWEFNCGGTFVSTNSLQFIVSPGYPDRYPNNIQCIYQILSPGSNKIVNLRFIDFDLEYGMPNCVSDNVTVQSLSNYYMPTKIYCDTMKPPDNDYRDGVRIKFMTDAWLVRRGFKFSFTTTGCGGNITSPTQISSPAVSSPAVSSITSNQGFVECVWNIIAPPKKIIALRFLQFLTIYSSSCAHDNIIVYDGLEKKFENKLATLCGNLNTSLPTLNSPNNTVTIISQTDSNNKDLKFVVDVFFTAGPAEGCGGVFNLTSPRTIVPPNIDETVDCYWRFMAPVNYVIKFELIEFDLEKCTTGACSCSFLEIRDGGTSLSTLMLKLCNSTNAVTTYQTSTRYGFLRLYTKGRSNSFRMKATPIISPCGNSALNVTTELRNLTSPNYPNQYPENIRCRWFLQSDTLNKRIVLRFKEFDLADETLGPVSNNVCKYDFLEIEHGDQQGAYGEGLGPSTIFSGRGKSSTVYEHSLAGVHTFCGRNEHIFDYYSPAGSFALIFQSKYGMNRGKGFLIEYQLAGCNRNYTDDFGRIHFTLSEAQDCLIGIEVQSNRTISLYFTYLYTGNFGNCSLEYLQVIDGNLTTGKEIGKLCGSYSMDPLFSTKNKIWLKFHSAQTYHIDLTYTSTNKGRGCGGYIYDTSGTFTSPMYPKDFRNNTHCIWHIRGPPGTRLKIYFTVFDIQDICSLNYLTVVTYANGLAYHNQFCKGDVPAVITSEVKALVIYKASIHNGGAGWRAFFTTS